MTDRDHPLERFAECVDILSCNRSEWAALAEPDRVAEQTAIVAVTDGARGIDVRFTDPSGEPGSFHVPAFPRDHPPRDTNRAGEAFGSTLVASLLDGGWDGSSRVVARDLVRAGAERAAAAAALVLDRLDFGFPTPTEIDAAPALASWGEVERVTDASLPRRGRDVPTRSDTIRSGRGMELPPTIYFQNTNGASDRSPEPADAAVPSNRKLRNRPATMSTLPSPSRSPSATVG